MKTIDLQVHKRETTGKREAKDLRKNEMVPGVIYDNSKAIHITASRLDLRKVIYSPDTYIVNLNLDGETYATVVRDADYHPLTDIVQHVEFLRVTKEKPVAVSLPIKFVGTAAGVAKGGKLAIKLRSLKIKGIAFDLPDKIQVNVSKLELGESIKVQDAEQEGIKILTSPSAAIATVVIPRALRSKTSQTEEAAAEAPAAE